MKIRDLKVGDLLFSGSDPACVWSVVKIDVVFVQREHGDTGNVELHLIRKGADLKIDSNTWRNLRFVAQKVARKGQIIWTEREIDPWNRTEV